MSYSPNVLRRAQARLSQRREERQARQEALRRQVYAQLPRVSFQRALCREAKLL